MPPPDLDAPAEVGTRFTAARTPSLICPPNRAVVRWLTAYWRTISMVVIEFALACVVWAWLQPEQEQNVTLAIGWVAQIYPLNLALIFLFAGGLHLYLYRLFRQGNALKFGADRYGRCNPR